MSDSASPNKIQKATKYIMLSMVLALVPLFAKVIIGFVAKESVPLQKHFERGDLLLLVCSISTSAIPGALALYSRNQTACYCLTGFTILVYGISMLVYSAFGTLVQVGANAQFSSQPQIMMVFSLVMLVCAAFSAICGKVSE